MRRTIFQQTTRAMSHQAGEAAKPMSLNFKLSFNPQQLITPVNTFVTNFYKYRGADRPAEQANTAITYAAGAVALFLALVLAKGSVKYNFIFSQAFPLANPLLSHLTRKNLHPRTKFPNCVLPSFKEYINTDLYY